VGISVKRNYDLTLLIQKIEKARIKPGDKVLISAKLVNEAEGVQFEGFRLQEYEAVLFSMLSFPKDIPEIDARRLLTKAIFQTAEKGTITRERLLATLNRLINEYLQQPVRRYVLATSLSISLVASLKMPRLRQGNTVIMFGQWPARFYQERVRILEYAQHVLHAEIPRNYLEVRVSINARTVYEAADNALRMLDLIRGVWNLQENWRHRIRWSSGRREPVNKILLGPLHTLHDTRGREVTSIWWYEPKYSGAVRVFRLTDDNIQKMYTFLKGTQKRLSKLPYREQMEEAIIRYTRALDERDWEGSFLRLWGVLELLTGNPDTYKVIIRRVSWLFGEGENEYHKQVLHHLKEYRNGIVHYDESSHAAETYLYQLKYYVEVLIRFHLWNRFGFKSLEEVWEFLDMPTQVEEIARQLRVRQLALRYQQEISAGGT